MILGMCLCSKRKVLELKLVFTQTHFPDVFLREELAARLNVSEDKIEVEAGDLRLLHPFF